MGASGVLLLNQRLDFLGLDVDTGQSFFSPVDKRWLPQSELARPILPRPLRYDIDGQDLASAGWGVVFGAGPDPAIRQALQPLIEHRQRLAGQRFRELTYKVRRRAGSFLSALRAGPGPVDPLQVPYYLLLVGHPHEIPYAFEIGLGAQHAVGRLAFDQPAAYRRYAQSVIRAETRASPSPAAVDLFAPSHTDDAATQACQRHLIEPLDRALRCRRPRTVRRCFAATQADRQQLLALLTDRVANVVLTAGHASMVRSDPDRQLARQGAVVCADWPGPGQKVLPEHTLGAEALPPAADLSGAVFVLFGCFTAGTPSHDSFADQDQQQAPRRLTEQPFVARLPQALLSHPTGAALAVVGHVDRAWPSSFEWQGFSQSGAFEDLLLATVDGRRIGSAMESFRLRHTDLATRLTRSHQTPETEPLEQAERRELWLAYHDTRSHVLLGDPAVRLSI